MLGNLYVVSTPIGNLEDITLRAINTLKKVDIIACEDTRVARKLLNHFNIADKKLISYYAPKEENVSDRLVELLKEGKDIALITDAGTPTISDPGYKLIKKAIQNGIKVVAVPGVSAVITALSVSGLPTDKFVFLGFLPKKESQKRQILEKYGRLNITMVIYVSPHQLLNTLEVIQECFPNGEIAVAKELTKLFENVFRGNTRDIFFYLKDNKDIIKGEFVVVLYPNYEEKKKLTTEDLINKAKVLLDKGYKIKEISKLIAEEYNLNKREVYKRLSEKLK